MIGRAVVSFLLLAVAAAAVSAERHALLVGVAKPVQIAEAPYLAGVENDIAVMKALAGDWGVAPERLKVLAGTGDGDGAPTYASLRTAFDRLTGAVKSGDEVLLYLSGHGTQQPAVAERDGSEDDGLDEVFLLADSTPWSPQSKTVGNALVDNELRGLLDALTKRGAFVWLVVDSCHAGTLARSGPQSAAVETEGWVVVGERRLAPEWLGIAIPRLRASPAGGAGGSRRIALRRRLPGLSFADASTDLDVPSTAAFYAVAPTDSAVEIALKANGRKVGLFTHELKKAFDGIRRKTASRPTLEELAAALLSRYRHLPAKIPRPLLESSEWKRPL